MALDVKLQQVERHVKSAGHTSGIAIMGLKLISLQ